MKEFTQPREHRGHEAIVRHYLPVLDNLYGKQYGNKLTMGNVSFMSRKDQKAGTPDAVRIMITPLSQETGTMVVMDYDDNLVDTSSSKRELHKQCTYLVPENARERFAVASIAINRAARVLPDDGTHPERYSPLLDLYGISRLVYDLNRPQSADIVLPTNEAEARAYIRKEIETVEIVDPAGATVMDKNGKPADLWPSLAVTIRPEPKNGEVKNYFIEAEEGAVSLFFGETRPQGVYQDVWNRYQRTMANAHIPEEEFENFDLPHDVRFSITTFGQLDLQLEKVARAITALKEHGQRLPDEVVVVMNGRKRPILEQLTDDIPDAEVIYVDDSVNQLKEMVGRPGWTVIHGWRAGTKRCEDGLEGIRKVDMRTTRHSELIAS